MKKNYFREDIAVEDRYNVVEDLYKSLPMNKKRVDAVTIENSIRLVVANFVYYKDSILIEHFSNRYKASPHRSFKTERRVIELFYALKYVDIYRGLSNKALKDLRDSGQDVSIHMENGKNKRSRMWLTDKGKDYFTGVTAKLELVCRRTKIKATKTARKRYMYFPFQVDEIEELERYKNFLKRLNDMMSRYSYKYIDAKTGEIIEFNNDYRIIFSGDEFNKIYNYTRRGGRFVSEVSYMWKQNRESITIDGKRSLEIDYKCSLPSIMFGKLGVDLSGLENDLYHVPGEKNCQYMRKLAKTIVVCMLGVTSEYTLEATLRNKLYKYKNGLKEDGYPVERFFPETFGFEDLKRVMEKILKRYKTLCPKVDKILFKKDLATNILQGIEARIATRIMNKFLQMGKPILCIHDSFRVVEEDEDLLYELMEEVYVGEVGMKPLGLKIDRQPVQDLQLNIEESVTDALAIAETSIETESSEPIELDTEGSRAAGTDEYGRIDAVDDVEGIQYIVDGITFRFNEETNQDYAFDAGFTRTWIAQGTRNAYNNYISVATIQ